MGTGDSAGPAGEQPKRLAAAIGAASLPTPSSYGVAAAVFDSIGVPNGHYEFGGREFRPVSRSTPINVLAESDTAGVSNCCEERAREDDALQCASHRPVWTSSPRDVR